MLPDSGWPQGLVHCAGCPQSCSSPSWRLLPGCCPCARPPGIGRSGPQPSNVPWVGGAVPTRWPLHFEHLKLRLCPGSGSLCIGGGAAHVLPMCGSLSLSHPPPDFTPTQCTCVSRELISWSAF